MTIFTYLSLRDDENSNPKYRTIAGGIVHAGLHGVPFVLSMTGLRVISNASEPSLGVVFFLSGVLAFMAARRAYRGYNKSKVETDSTRLLRNLLSTGLLAAAFVFLGQSDASNSTLNRDSLIAVIVLTCLAKLGDVFANKEDVWREDSESRAEYFLVRQNVTYVLIVLSTIALGGYKGSENTNALSFDHIREGVLIGAFSVFGVHLMIPLGNMIITQCSTLNWIAFTRIPLFRHLATSTGISFLAYALGYGVGKDEEYIYLLLSLIGYLLADAVGRGMDVVAL